MKVRCLCALVLVLGCGSEEKVDSTTETERARWRVELAAAAQELRTRPELDDELVTVQHILLGVQGGGTAAQRSAAEALELTAELYARIRAGEDFDALMRNYSDDEPPGTYTLALHPDSAADALRSEMARGFGDAAWRLRPGELGVVCYDGDAAQPAAPLGNHIVKRLK
jgi:hypothetical protein